MRTARWRPAALMIWLAGCGSSQLHRDGLELVRHGQADAGVRLLARAVADDPGNAKLRRDHQVQREALSEQLLSSARTALADGKELQARELLVRLLATDPGHLIAADMLRRIELAREQAEALDAARRAFAREAFDEAQSLLRPILQQSPNHPQARPLQREVVAALARLQAPEPALRAPGAQPVNLDFRDASVRQVFEALSRSTGISFILDRDLGPELKTTVFLRNAYVDEAIELILRTSQLRSKLLGNNTVLIYPDTPEKLKTYQDLVVRAFYLHGANAAQMQSSLKTLLKSRDMVVDEKLNMLVMRDTPEAIRLAEKIIALHDLTEPEVMLEMEVLEVQQDALLNLGVQWPAQLTLTPLSSGNGGLTLDDLRSLSSSRIGAALSSPVVNLRQDHGVTNLLANPRIRAKNREKARVMIGDKVPVITSTSTSTGFVAESVQYLDVGLKLDVEPSVHPGDDVEIKVNLEVSSIAKQISTSTGTVAYQIGTRNASTVLRLKDGQTQILAGLINDQDRVSASGVPGLSRLPLVGRLFSAPLDSRTKNEIVLSITPRLVRPIVRPEARETEFWSGTEGVLSEMPFRLGSTVSKVPQKAESPATTSP
jgi:general secretion pathway protein D